jgi:tetratricopeptide (TPR) repeat protein
MLQPAVARARSAPVDAKAFRLSLDSRARATMFASTVVVIVLAFALEAGRTALSQHWGNSYDEHKIEQAIKLDPANPEFHYWLGMLHQENGESSVGVPSLRTAVTLNPNVAKYWLGLAQACFAAEDRACADHAFQRAIELAPSKPEMQWSAALSYAMAGDMLNSVSHLRRLLELRPDRVNDVLMLAWRAFDKPEVIWPSLIQPTKNVTIQTAYLEFLAGNDRFDLTKRYWAQIAPGIGGTNFALFNPYLQRLTERHQYEQVRSTWQDLLDKDVVRASTSSCLNSAASPNLIYNPCFDVPPLNGGLDWQSHEQEFVSVDVGLDEGNRHYLQVEYSAPHNNEDEPVFQLVPVEPNAKYELTAIARSEAITSDSGPRLRVFDPRCPQCLDAATEGVTGTTSWHPLKVEFSSGPATSFVRISVWRPKSRTYPMEISGQVWLGAVSLRRVGP